MKTQNFSQSYNPSSILGPPYTSPDLLNLLHLPRCSASSLHTNPTICLTNPNSEHTKLSESTGISWRPSNRVRQHKCILSFVRSSIPSEPSSTASSPQRAVSVSPSWLQLANQLTEWFTLWRGWYRGRWEPAWHGSAGIQQGHTLCWQGKGRKATKHFATEKQRATEWKVQNLEKSYPKPHQGIQHIIYEFSD